MIYSRQFNTELIILHANNSIHQKLEGVRAFHRVFLFGPSHGLSLVNQEKEQSHVFSNNILFLLGVFTDAL